MLSGAAISEEKANIQTIYYQGMLCSQTQMAKYIGERYIQTSVGKFIGCNGRNNLKPIDVIYNPFIGKEIQDVNTEAMKSHFYLNPIKIVFAAGSRISNWYNGIKFFPGNSASYQQGEITYHVPNFSKISIGQETDIASHQEKYNLWKASVNKAENLILYGVSRGAATTFNAFSRYKYSEVKLVILEGCFYSVDDVLTQKHMACTNKIINTTLNLFTQYKKNGPSPATSVADFPENIPVVFISSKMDKVVPYCSTVKLANELASKGKNEVYLLTLNHSSHPNYMFDDREDRDKYETFIHAIYEKYGLTHKKNLAEIGAKFLDESLISNLNTNKNVDLSF